MGALWAAKGPTFLQAVNRVHTHKFVLNSRTFQGFQKDSLMDFQGLQVYEK